MGHSILNNANLDLTANDLSSGFCHESLQATHVEFCAKTTIPDIGAAVHVSTTAPATSKLWVKVDGSGFAEGCTGIHFYNTDTSAWEVFSSTPSGTLNPFAGTSTPDGWLLCDGSEVSQTTYARLYAAIGDNYNVTTPASGNFMVPDMRGRVAAGKDDMGGSAASRLTNPATTTGGVDGDTLGATGGEEAHTLLEAETPSHSHAMNTGSSTSGVASLEGNSVSWGSLKSLWYGTSAVTGSAGDDVAHNTVQPTLIANYIIKT